MAVPTVNISPSFDSSSLLHQQLRETFKNISLHMNTNQIKFLQHLQKFETDGFKGKEVDEEDEVVYADELEEKNEKIRELEGELEDLQDEVEQSKPSDLLSVQAKESFDEILVGTVNQIKFVELLDNIRFGKVKL